MMNIRRFLCCSLLLLLFLTAFVGCGILFSDADQRPSPLTTQPPPPPPEIKRENRGGFTVLVDAPGQPSTGRVFADVGAFALGRGFVRRTDHPASPADATTPATTPVAPQRYFLGDIALDVTSQSGSFQVVASLHGFNPRLNRKFFHAFYQDFREQYGMRYGGEPAMFEN